MTAEIPTGPRAERDLHERGGNVRGRGYFGGGGNIGNHNVRGRAGGPRRN